MRVKRTFTFNGKRYYADGATALEAEQARERMKMELRMGLRSDGSMTVRQLSEIYMGQLENSRKNLREKTLKQKRSLIERKILPAIGDMAVKDVTQIHIMVILNELAKNHTTTDYLILSPSSAFMFSFLGLSVPVLIIRF